MLIGLDSKIKRFKSLAEKGDLAASYLFFGEPQVGKFLFARSLVNYLETGVFGAPQKILIDALILSSDVLGIEIVREAKKFLWQKPLRSRRRAVIFDRAENFTPEAQNALLKITEEPPASALLILIASDVQILAPTLASRFIKIYFPRLSTETLLKHFSPKAAGAAFGRPGRALDISTYRNIEKVDEKDEEDIDRLMENYYLLLRQDLKKNSGKLSWLLQRHALLKRYNLNQKLQLRAIGNAVK